jgi:hypothetical protein
MSAAEPIARLMPRPLRDKDLRRERAAVTAIVREIVIAAASTRSSEDLLVEVYLAGLWHGSELVRQRLKASIDEVCL